MEIGVKSIQLPLKYVKDQGGKEIRSKLITAFNYWLKVPEENEKQVQEIIDTLHNATLLIDDIEDGSVLRRGSPVAHLIYGVPITINSANFYYFKVMEKIIEYIPKDKLNDAILIYVKRMLELHTGQGADLFWTSSQILPSFADYKKMISLKTTALFGFALDLLKLFSKKEIQLDKLVNLFGEYFQIRDDYANLKLKEYADKKTFAEDITEGKLSFPVIHALQINKNDPIILNILKMKTESFEIKKYAVDYLEKCGSLEYTYNEIEKLYYETKDEIKRLGGNPLLEAALDKVGLPKDDN